MTKNQANQKLIDFACEWKHWHYYLDTDDFSAWSVIQQEGRTFTRAELDLIDPRVYEVLTATSENDGSGDKHTRLKNSVYIWEHPERRIDFPDGRMYWQRLLSLKATSTGKVKIMFLTPTEVLERPSNVTIATSVLMNASKEMPWAFWKSIYPNIEKLANIAETMGMDEYQTAQYCESMLFSKLENSMCSAILPEADLT